MPAIVPIDRKLRTDGIIFTLRAIADPPAKLEEASYRLTIDGTGEMTMKFDESDG